MTVSINLHTDGFKPDSVEVTAHHTEEGSERNFCWLQIQVNGSDVTVSFPHIQAMKDFVDAQAIAVNKMLIERAGE